MPGFPINLDLTVYFNDLRKYSSVFVNLAKFKDVGDVESHIKSLFKLEDNICLLSKKFLIPKSEDVQILQQYEILKVQKCDFYDLQIHKVKRGTTHPPCDQNALNLIQSEKSIDLSCRPKQRLRSNICKSPGISGALTPLLDNDKCTDLQLFPSTIIISDDDNQIVSKEKQKHKKKRHMQNEESNEDVGIDSNILDMSVKKSKINKHVNCFFTEDGVEVNGDGSIFCENVSETNHKGDSKELQKKPKKRKKPSQLSDDDLDLADTCWNNLVSSNNSFTERSCKKKTKKPKDDFMIRDLSLDSGSIQNTETPANFDNKTTNEDCSERKRHKKSKKSSEPKGNLDIQNNQYYSNSSPLCDSISSSPRKSSTFQQNYVMKEQVLNFESTKSLEDHKKRMKDEIDKIIDHMHQEKSSTKSSHTNGNNGESDNSSNAMNNDNTRQVEECHQHENENSELSCEFSGTNSKRKRKRKHNKKKKRDKLMYMSAVGPALSQLALEPQITKTSPSSDIGKHIFFTEEDFVEEMKIPPTPPNRSQVIQGSSEPCGNHAEFMPSQEAITAKPPTWQDKLLKLASTSIKPVIFHRSTAASSDFDRASSSSQHSQQGSSQPHSKPNSNAENPEKNLSSNCNDISSHGGGEVNIQEEDFRSCNGELKTENEHEEGGSCSETVSACDSRNILPDVIKPRPIPNDIQSINLTNYPIIDKVVAEDLILFKVLKLNENNEPGVSKTILAKVNGSSNFPDRISLQIMEGCEECDDCKPSERSGEAFIIELRWTDILEPRLFYP